MDFLKKTLRNTLIEVLSTIIFTLLGLIITSKFNTGYFLNYLNKITPITIFIIIITSFSIVIFIKIIRINTENSISLPSKESESDSFEIEYGTINYSDVIWKFYYQVSSRRVISDFDGLHPSLMIVKPSPFCPKCNTELIENKALLTRFLWDCPDCSFKKRISENKYNVAKKAEKIVIRNIEQDWEKETKEQGIEIRKNVEY